MTSYCHPYRHIVIWSHHPGDLCSCLATIAAAWSTELGIYTQPAQTVRRRTGGPLVTCPPGCEGMESGWRWLEVTGVAGGDWSAVARWRIFEGPHHGQSPRLRQPSMVPPQHLGYWIVDIYEIVASNQVAMATRQMLEISNSSWKEYRSSKEAETIFEPYCFPSLPSQQYSPLLQVWKFSEICQSWVSGYENVYFDRVLIHVHIVKPHTIK